MTTAQRAIAGWGRYPVQTCELSRPERYAELQPAAGPTIARGQGRAYGDAALNAGHRVVLTERVNRMLAFDAERGTLRAEAGVTLAEVLEVIVPRGWFLPVTPGTRHASLGGCVAADVHGKNHHRDGSFGQHVLELELVLADGNHARCSPEDNAELFWATVGGMGLTGIIGEVSLKLLPVETAYLVNQQRQAGNLNLAFKLLEENAWDDHHSVAWIDCLARGAQLGRSVVMRGHHARRDDLPERLRDEPLTLPQRRARSVPCDLPGWVLNPLSIGAFNALYYRRGGSVKEKFLTGYDRFFYPLDGLAHWNRLYGQRGFVQYQCLLPGDAAYRSLELILEKLAASRRASFLGVLKRFGPGNAAALSFPQPGYTLALDLPMKNNGLFALLDELDEIVLRSGGRVYLAKDARLSAESFRAMYPRWRDWLRVKQLVDPDWTYSSSLSRRLGLEDSLAG